VSLSSEILRSEPFVDAPPILVDVGASGGVHRKWKPIAKHCVCIAFEPDERERRLERRHGDFRELWVVNRPVAERAERAARFHLTRSPYCSSLLEPDADALARYALAPLFDVERVEDVETVELRTVLAEAGHERVDWFKSDSQGTDLRLFASLGDDVTARVLLVELEPGIIDGYRGEDKLADAIRELSSRGFWMSGLRIEGWPRFRRDLLERRLGPLERRFVRAALRPAPGWGEAEWLSAFESAELFGERELLLGFVFASLRGHHGFALELAVRGRERFGGETFRRLERASLRRVRAGVARAPAFVAGRLLARRA
jgi:FkbM family methyltransferase